MDRTPPHLHRRRVDLSSFAALAPLAVVLPFSLISLRLIWIPVSAILNLIGINLSFWVVPIAWTLAACCLFLRFAQTLVLSPALGARSLTSEEHDVAQPIWEQVSAAAGIDPNRFVLRVIDADELNAFACGGHMVVTTSFSLRNLNQRELAGVFAHELSHHLGLHTISLTLIHWYSLPIIALARIGFALKNIARAATETFVAHSSALTAVGTVIAGVLTGVSWVFLSVLYASDAVGNLVGHRSEFDADQRSIQLGYGNELVAALNRVITFGGGQRSIGWRQRLRASHPPARTRVARIEAALRHPSGI
ncbi:MAG: M48 family metalloprotease [Ilumatobacteraceae bacterium]